MKTFGRVPIQFTMRLRNLTAEVDCPEACRQLLLPGIYWLGTYPATLPRGHPAAWRLGHAKNPPRPPQEDGA
jgi:hypothetical protein